MAAIGMAALCYSVSALCVVAMRGRGSPRRPWFRLLRKAEAQPPDWVFGPVWTVAACGSCGRARCAAHLADGMCDRCNRAIRREMIARSGARWWMSWTVAVISAVIPMAAGSGVGLPIGAILGVGTYLALYRHDRRSLVALLGPALAASRGELPPPPRDYESEPDRERIPPQSPNV